MLGCMLSNYGTFFKRDATRLVTCCVWMGQVAIPQGRVSELVQLQTGSWHQELQVGWLSRGQRMM